MVLVILISDGGDSPYFQIHQEKIYILIRYRVIETLPYYQIHFIKREF